MTDKIASTGNRIVEDGPIEVQLRTGREFCAEQGIDHIDYLKVDAEGHDLEVLKGFDLGIVDFVQVEASANRHMLQAVPFAVLYDYLCGQGFYLFGLYGPAWEFKQGPHRVRQLVIGRELMLSNNALPILRRIDPVFISERLVGPIEAQEL
jgi:hypothetical protein